MNLTKIWRMIGKEVKETRRSGLLSLIILFPLLLLLPSLPLLSQSPLNSHTSIAVVANDTGDASSYGNVHSISKLSSNVYFVATEEEAFKMLKGGKISAFIVVGKKPQIFAENSFYGIKTASAIQSVLSDSKISYFPSLSFLFLALIAQASSLFLASTTISRERETGTLRLLILYRFSAFEVITGKFLAVLLMSLVPVFLGMIVLSLYSTKLILFLLLLMAASASAGMVFSTAFSKENAVILATLFLFANAIATFYSLHSLPERVSYLLPLTQVLDPSLERMPFLILYSLIALSLSMIVFGIKKRGEVL
ncbi:MAG: ABC transporter permease [Archaeoglobus sp.]|nr:ABC transporter permease [Archaeoglobus sp.]